MEIETKQIFSKIYQDLKEEMINNTGNTFLKEYVIPRVNYGEKGRVKELHCYNNIQMEFVKVR